MPARLHAIVQNTNDFDQSGLNYAIVEYMPRPLHLFLRIIAARMPNVEAADAGQQVGPVSYSQSLRVSCDLAHRRSEESCVATLAFRPPAFGARCKETCEISLRRMRKTKARH